MTESSRQAASPGLAHDRDDASQVHTPVVDESSSRDLLAAAARRLLEGKGPVELAGVATLRPEAGDIVGELRVCADAPAPRCEEEFKVMIENASRALAGSRLAAHLARPLRRWRLVQESGANRIQLWPVD